MSSSSPARPLIIAIDGPSGAGKGTVARTLAVRLGYTHVDTGAMYRAVAWKGLHDSLPLDDEDAIVALAQRADIVVDAAQTAPDIDAALEELPSALDSIDRFVAMGSLGAAFRPTEASFPGAPYLAPRPEVRARWQQVVGRLLAIPTSVGNVGEVTIPDAVIGWRLGPKVVLAHLSEENNTPKVAFDTLRPVLRKLVPEAEIVTRPRFSTLSYAGAKKLSRLPRPVPGR